MNLSGVDCRREYIFRLNEHQENFDEMILNLLLSRGAGGRQRNTLRRITWFTLIAQA